MSTELEARLRSVAAALDDAADRYETVPGTVVELPARRRPLVLVAVAAAVIAVLVATAMLARPDARVRTTDPVAPNAPEPSEIQVIPPPAGVHAAMTVDEVEQVVLDEIRRNELLAGKAVTPAHITSIAYDAEVSLYDNDPRGFEVLVQFPGWVIEFEGTLTDCGGPRYCSVADGGSASIRDRPGVRTPYIQTNGGPYCFIAVPDGELEPGLPPC